MKGARVVTELLVQKLRELEQQGDLEVAFAGGFYLHGEYVDEVLPARLSRVELPEARERREIRRVLLQTFVVGRRCPVGIPEPVLRQTACLGKQGDPLICRRGGAGLGFENADEGLPLPLSLVDPAELREHERVRWHCISGALERSGRPRRLTGARKQRRLPRQVLCCLCWCRGHCCETTLHLGEPNVVASTHVQPSQGEEYIAALRALGRRLLVGGERLLVVVQLPFVEPSKGKQPRDSLRLLIAVRDGRV
ncbi:MAG: hypothetical protein ACO3JL_06155 [Myxococcota bacterium]